MKIFLFLLLGLLAVAHSSASALGDQLQFNLDHNDGESAASSTDGEKMKMPIQFQINGETYFYHEKQLSFWSAENDCKRTGGHLASIHTEDINKYVNGVVLHYKSNADRTWLGGYRRESYRYFYWIDGSKWDYSRWGLTENWKKSNRDTCVQMDHRKQGVWVVAYCYESRPYVCKL
ncbi:lectin-like [Protopterus annectens]|uniref:lectin-like n=1 Tax=Protopterus annectens TaxID=7888 RepID=UPI001CFAC65E|nr:lectin-like [Protopterus annectens]